MKCKIEQAKTQGCDKISKVYCDNFNTLRPLYFTEDNVAVLGNIQINLDKMDVFDRSALGLYIGKFLEQEINSSVVQLMRNVIGIDMPEFYCKRDPQFWDDRIIIGNRTMRLNKQENPSKRESLKTIPAGDAYYALEQLKKEFNDFDDYDWLNDNRFLDAWRKLFGFRNKVAHIGHLISQEELEKAFEWFEVFLSFMPNIKELKAELAPDYMFEDNQPKQHTEIHASNIDNNKSVKPQALPEQYFRLRELLDSTEDKTDAIYQEINELYNGYNWHTIIFEGNDHKKGMKHVDGSIIVPAIFDDFGFTFDCIFLNFPCIPALKNGKLGLVKCDGHGSAITEFIYDSIESIPWNSHVFAYKKGGSLAVGLLHANGKELCPCIIDKYYEPSQTSMIFKSGDYYGLYDLDEKIVMPMFDNIEIYDPFEPMVFTLNSVPGYLDHDFKFVPKSHIDAIEDEGERYDKMLEFLPADYE